MTASKLALAAKKVIDAAWLNGPSYDLSSQAAFALESAQLLQSPETAAELKRLRDRVTELETAASDQQRKGFQAAIEVMRQEKLPMSVGLLEAQLELDDLDSAQPDGITQRIAPTQALRDEEDVTPQVRKLRSLLAGQRADVADPNGLHHDYRLGRDLPTGGA